MKNNKSDEEWFFCASPGGLFIDVIIVRPADGNVGMLFIGFIVVIFLLFDNLIFHHVSVWIHVSSDPRFYCTDFFGKWNFFF